MVIVYFLLQFNPLPLTCALTVFFFWYGAHKICAVVAVLLLVFCSLTLESWSTSRMYIVVECQETLFIYRLI